MRAILFHVSCSLFLIFFFAVLNPLSIAFGSVETFTATHTYILGDRDSKDEARQRCLLEAKRQILEQAGVYIESTTQSKDFSVTKDLITSYASAVMRIKDIQERVAFEKNNMTMTLTITAEVDPVEVREQLARYPTASVNGEKRNNDAERLKQLHAQIEEIQKQEHLAWLDYPVRKQTHEKPSMPIVDTDIKEMTFQAEQGDARAQNSLGWLYYAGIGVESDRVKAKQWFEKSALAGNGMARIELLVNGSKVVRDSPSLGREWLMQAGEQGNVAAQYWLGMHYAVGSHVPDVSKDLGKARHWFQKSATQGNWLAQSRLAEMYSSGMGVPRDYVRSHMWYSLVITNSNSSKSALTHAEEGRAFVAQFMTPAQVTEAQRMECEVQGLTGC